MGLFDLAACGLGAGMMAVWLLGDGGGHAPRAYGKVAQWWLKVGPKSWNGKPLVCPFCMCFWLAMFLALVSAFALEGPLALARVLLRDGWAAGALALLTYRAAEQLNTVVLR